MSRARSAAVVLLAASLWLALPAAAAPELQLALLQNGQSGISALSNDVAVSPDGLVSAVGVGPATVRASFGGAEGSASVLVTARALLRAEPHAATLRGAVGSAPPERVQVDIRDEGEVVVALQFLSPGRHAGPGGDVAEICTEAEATAKAAGKILSTAMTAPIAYEGKYPNEPTAQCTSCRQPSASLPGRTPRRSSIRLFQASGRSLTFSSPFRISTSSS